MNINLKLLHAFLAVAEQQSFRKAAEGTNRTQAAISSQIKQLEEQLGVSLFDRTTRRVELTSAGEHLLLCTKKSLAELDIGLQQVKDTANAGKGHVTFACVPTVASTRLPYMLLAFQNEHPGISVQVNELPTLEALENLRKQDVDFAIARHVDMATDFHFEPIYKERIIAVLPKKFAKPGRTDISLDELASLPILKFSDSGKPHDALNHASRSRGLMLSSRHEFQNATTQLAMAAIGLAVAILPEIAVALTKQLDVQCLPIVNPPLTRVLCIVTLRGRALSPVAAKLLPIIKQYIDPVVGPQG